MYPYLYVTKRGVLLGLEGLHRVKSTLGFKINQYWGLSKKVSYFFIPQGAWKWQPVKLKNIFVRIKGPL